MGRKKELLRIEYSICNNDKTKITEKQHQKLIIAIEKVLTKKDMQMSGVSYLISTKKLK